MTKKKRSDNTQRFALQKRGCFGKIQHKSMLSAEYVLSRMKSKKSGILGIYKCTFCDFYHIGHDNKKENYEKALSNH